MKIHSYQEDATHVDLTAMVVMDNNEVDDSDVSVGVKLGVCVLFILELAFTATQISLVFSPSQTCLASVFFF